ncbi:MAG: 16S rRNA processing protein RimM [Pseudomonadales bacterium]|nr:16S rRNA processing protein RimM [Pseudomonadales bacterium]
MSDTYLVIGHTCGIYGLKGWVKVKSFTEPDNNFLAYKECFICTASSYSSPNPSWQPAKIDNGKVHGKGLVAKFAGFADRTAVEKFGKFFVAIKQSELPELKEEEYYWHQLEGLEVWVVNPTQAESDNKAQERVLLGKVHHLLETGSNDVLVVQASEGSLDDKERLLPYRPEVVLSVDLKSASMEVDWDTEF